MVRRQRAAILPNNIILLQNLVRRDPKSYEEEFLQQYSHYQSLRDIYLSDANSGNEGADEFGELIGFVSSVCQCFPQETKQFPSDLNSLLINNYKELDVDLREKIIQCLVMLRNKDVISPEFLIQTIFPLLISQETSIANIKQLRKQIYQTLISLLKAVNVGSKNQKLNRSTQALLFNLLEQQTTQGLWATRLTRELWRRGIWDDSRTVEIMTHAALHPDVKVSIAGVKFFLGADKERDEAQDSDDDEEPDLAQLKHQAQITKKTGKKAKKLETALKTLKKKGSAKHSATYLNFSAIHLLRDPQGFADELFSKQLQGKRANKYSLEQKIDIVNLISRLIGTHKLTCLGIYTFLLKFLTPKQQDVTQFMAAAAQASHDLVPPESITIVVKKIADEFISDGVATEVAAAGLNTVREILARAPLAIDADLLQDLTEYKGSKAKSVMMAARSLITLYREVAPEMLARKDRGKEASMGMKSGSRKGLPQFGLDSALTNTNDLALLAKWKEEHKDEDKVGDEWEVEEEEEEESDEGEWVNVDDDTEAKTSGKKRAYEDDDSDLELSDDERNTDKNKNSDKDSNMDQVQKLLSSDILTPADFAKLHELKTKAGVEKIMGQSIFGLNEQHVDSSKLVGSTKYKQNKEERLAHVKAGRDEDAHGSRRGKREGEHSTTNKEKARKKNFLMTIHKRGVQSKQKMALRDKQKVLRAHIDKQKKKGH
ncbi:Actin cytoskeleton organization [Komagataella phaffii CBS 7435]|uniref:Protein SDA1 n=2 Tax=Komagataella phaffii TaxID=460519 RepID=C4QY29_KOMPG|nr:uncharacterized protein PAS_chr1-4_0311 [Komagataella phaffii GS115]AOA61581.1 GQ67_01861T0 [Komagataella phaffii]CAH2446972.1 Actin cytoskeleton organization [Komagataella phaffii CBS 7435]AOA65704.1 GQ68_01876T0 [Komagataella phaffii GS115]CAY68152.1 Highly conserved nuclear protein required for actin cytoskeleton organization [Komagataella phaffii GS115]CCA37227.1 Actin cytoskeleton organization [Komagataella phaffii CBS 7435]